MPPPPNLWKRSDNSIARVQYIAVAEKVRGQGVGAALYERLMTELGDKGVRLVEASIAAHNSSSIRLHRRSGWTLYSDGRRVLAERRLEEKAVA
jgi:L-amino acid N-acyltransferase YncA